MMKSRLPKSTIKKYLMVLACVWIVWLAGTALLYGFVLGPQSAQLETLQKKMQAAIEDYDLAQRTHRPETKQNLQKRLEKTVETINEFAVNNEAASRLAIVISQLAAQYSLSDFSVKTREVSPTLDPKDKNSIAEAWLELTFSAPFGRCAAYINALERNEPVIFVESADISRPMTAAEEPSARLLVSYLIDTEQAALTQIPSLNQPLTAAAE